MNTINDAYFMTINTLMFIPLIVFCFLPVANKIKSSKAKLTLKIILAVLVMECLIFGIFLFSTSAECTLFVMFFVAAIFFWLYQKEVDCKRLHLWFVFVTAMLIGSFGFMIYHTFTIFFGTSAFPASFLDYYALLSQIFFEVALILIFYYPTKKHLHWLIFHFHEEKLWGIAWVFPVSFIILSKALIPYDEQNQMFTGKAMEMYLIFLFVFLIIIIFLYIMFYQVAYRMVEKQEILERASYLEIQGEQYRALQEHVQETKRIRHDFHHQLIVLERMLKNKDYVEAQAFLAAYSQDTAYSLIDYCDSIAINAILNHYVTICHENDIMSQFHIQLENTGSMQDIDFCVMLGNLLENAVYGCQQVTSSNRRIDLKIAQTTAHVIVLQITNPFVGTIKKFDDKFLSSRHAGTGQGIRSVQLIAEKYDGFINIKHEHHQFVVKVLVNI